MISDSLVFFLYFLYIFFFLFSIHRGIRGTISWSIWSSEHWCRSLGNARKAKQWLWCVISHKQPHWQEFIKGHLAVVLQNLFSQFSNFLRHHMYFFTSCGFSLLLSHSLAIFLFSSFDVIFCLHCLKRVVLVLPSLLFQSFYLVLGFCRFWFLPLPGWHLTSCFW